MLFQPEWFRKARLEPNGQGERAGQGVRSGGGVRSNEAEATLAAVLGLSATARKDGLLALESAADGAMPSLAEGIRAVVDGADHEAVRSAAIARLEAEGSTGDRLLAGMIAAEGILGIQAGAGPESLELRLAAYLGADRFGEALRRIIEADEANAG